MLQTCSLMLPLGGCLLSGDMPEPNLVVPASYDGGPKNPAAAQAALPPLDWWTKFRSRELTALIEEARTNNLDIAAAIARIVQADAQARVTGAALLPVVDLNGDGDPFAGLQDPEQGLRRQPRPQHLQRPPATSSPTI